MREVLGLFLLGVLVGCNGHQDLASVSSPVQLVNLSLSSYDTTQATLLVRGAMSSSQVTALNQIILHTASDCSDPAIGQGTAAGFNDPGISVHVSSTAPSSLYVSTNTLSGCFFLAAYTPTHPTPPSPLFLATSPTSPSRSSTTPLVTGTASPLASTIKFYGDSACTALVGSGSVADFATVGIATVLQGNQINHVYARAFEPFGAASPCAELFTFENTTSGPGAPSFTSTTPVSPSNVSLTPLVKGAAPTGVDHLVLFSDAACSLAIGNGLLADFSGAGLTVQVLANATTTIYAVAYDTSGDPSFCTYLTSYTHDNVAPLAPTFVAATPASPTNATIYPAIQGTSSPDTLTVRLFDSLTCTHRIGTGARNDFIASGVTAQVSSNQTTSIYAEDVDAAGNASACVFMTSYVNNTIPPQDPVFGTTAPVSPNNVSPNPLITGNVDPNTVSIAFFNDVACSNSIGSGTAGDYLNNGITIHTTPNQTNYIYGIATDLEGNLSACTALTAYEYSNQPAPPPTFLSSTPISPNNFSTHPTIFGTAPSSVKNVQIFTDSLCATEVGTTTRNAFASAGISVAVPANATTQIFATSFDKFGNSSPCTLLTTYVHDNLIPPNPVFTSVLPASPNNQSYTPFVFGTANNAMGGVLPVSSVSLYSDILCINSIGTSSPSQFTASGIQATANRNALTTIYAQSRDDANNLSNCSFMLNYIYDVLPPGAPILSFARPASPSYSTHTAVVGTLTPNTDIEPATTVRIYSDSLCTQILASGSPTLFAGAGLSLTVAENSTTTLYGSTLDAVGNVSACQHLQDFVEADNGPTGLTATQNSNGSVSLAWNPDTTASPQPSYVVQRSLTSGGPYTVLATNNLGTSFTDSNVSNGVTFYYVVAATNNTGTSLNSLEVPVTISASTTQQPILLTASPGPATVTLTWSGWTTDLNYTVSRATQSGGPYVPIAAALSGTVYVDTTVSNGTPYYYVVQGLNPSGVSVYSAEVSVLPLDVPSAPLSLNLVALAAHPACGGLPGVQLSWSAPAYTNGAPKAFAVNRGSTSGGESPHAQTDSNSYVDCNPAVQGGSTTSGHYNYNYYTVSALWGPNNSPSQASNEVSFANLAGVNLLIYPGNNSINLAWGGLQNATSYSVYRTTTSGANYVLLTTLSASATGYTDTTVTNGTAYYYYVSAAFAGVLGIPSSEVSAVPGPNPTTAPTSLALNYIGGQVTLNWAPPSKYDYFNIYRNGAFYTTASSPTFQEAVQAGLYQYYVTAVWGAFETGPSNTVSFRGGVPTSPASTSTATLVKLGWNCVSGASGYYIYRGTAAGQESSTPYATVDQSVCAGSPQSASFSDTGASAANGYFYTIASYYSDSTVSQTTSEINGALLGTTTPRGMTVTATTGNTASLSWVSVNMASSYNVYLATSLGGVFTKVAFSASNFTTVGGLAAGHTYYFKVTALTPGESTPSTVVSAYTAATASLALLVPGNHSVQLQWQPVGATSYSVLRSTNGTNFSVLQSGLTSGIYTDTTAANGILYYYQIASVYPSTTLYSPNVTLSPPNFVTAGLLPSVPQGLLVTANTNGTDLSLNWGAVTGALGYNIYYSTTSGSGYQLASTVAAPPADVTDLFTPNTTYYLVVSAYNGIESSTSNEVVVIPSVTPVAPTVLALNSTSIGLNWPAVPGAATYLIQRTSDLVNYTTLNPGAATSALSFTDSGASSQISYAYTYLPLDANGTPMAVSAPSVTVALGILPLAPLNLTAYSPAAPTVQLNWAATPGASTYNVYRGSSASGPFTLQSNVPTPPYTDTSGAANQTYYYVVTSLNSVGVESTHSNVAGVNLSGGPSALSATVAINAVNLSWSAVSGATGYVVRRGLVSGGPYGVIANGLSGTTFQDTTAVQGTTYFYVVDATLSGGVLTPNSPEAQAVGSTGLNLSVPIELTDQALSSDTIAKSFSSTQTSLDPTAYDGTVTYEFEIVATNNDVTQTVTLIDSNAGVRASISVPSSSFSPVRLRSAAFAPNASPDIYQVSLPATSSGGLLQVLSARLIVTQIGATKTKIYIPLLASGTAPTTGDVLAPVESVTGSTFTNLTSATLYLRNALKYSSLPNFNAWSLETLTAATNGAIGQVGLYDVSQSQIVTDTVGVFGQPAVTLIQSPFGEGIPNFASPTNDSDEYQISLVCQSGCPGGQIKLYKAGLWVTVNQLSYAEIFWRNALAVNNAGSAATIDLERTRLDLNLFSNPAVYFQAILDPGSGFSTVSLLSDGTDDQQLNSTATISGSTLSFGFPGKTLQKTSAPLSITSGYRYLPALNPQSGFSNFNSSFVVIDVHR